jgi:Spy/CpxP family protein refolding chaperone
MTSQPEESAVMNSILVVACFLMMSIVLFPQRVASAQTATPHITSRPMADNEETITDEDIQMLRKDIRSQRKQIIAANMNLSDSEAEKFWPVYEQYVSDLVKLNGTKYALIKQYIQTKGALTDTEAEAAVNQWVSIDQSVGELRKKYIPLFRKVLTAKNTALFYQLDRRVQMMIDLQLASSIPMIQP